MNAGAVVTVLTDNASVTVDYRTGRIELRPGTCRTAPHPTLRHVRGGPSWGTSETLAVLPDAGSAPARWRAAALPVLLVVVGVRVIGPRRSRFARLVALGCYGRCRRPATREQAVHAVRAVRWAARLVPARWGCLEQSVAAALLLACAGRRAEWRHGMATDPIRLHAWIADSAGRPVEEPDETCLYTPICTPDGPGAPPGPREEHTP